MIDELRDYIRSCPLINKKKKLYIDYLGTDTGEYTIDVMPGESVVKKYADGGSLRKLVFVFGSKEYYGSDIRTNIENSGFYDKFQRWIEEQNEIGNLPNIENVQSVNCVTYGYLFNTDGADKARYQIQMEMIYYKGV